jgi:16S rRNA (uracil1498-N3)-methyltransferase
MAERFYVNSPLMPGPVDLTGPQAHHLAVVCRLRPGDSVCLFNGDGRQYPALVESVQKKHIALTVTRAESPQRELPLPLEIAVVLPKGDRATFLVEKLTELGVSRLVPLRTVRSVVHPGDGKIERLNRVVIEASKQCGRNMLMQVEAMMDWEDYCRRGELPTERIMAHLSAESGPWTASGKGPLAFAVGPEGGFTDEEATLALRQGWRMVSLGPRVLRVETAAIALAACAVDAVRSGNRLALKNG